MSHHVCSACSFLPWDQRSLSLVVPTLLIYATQRGWLCKQIMSLQLVQPLGCFATLLPRDPMTAVSYLPPFPVLGQCVGREAVQWRRDHPSRALLGAQDFCGSGPRMGFPGISLSDGDSRLTWLPGSQGRSSEHNTDSTARASQSTMSHMVM